MTTGQIVILTSAIGLGLAAYLFIKHYLHKDGIARIIFLVYTGTFFMFFLLRLINQILRATDILNPKQASEWTVTNTSLLLIPLVATLLIELYYKFK